MKRKALAMAVIGVLVICLSYSFLPSLNLHVQLTLKLLPELPLTKQTVNTLSEGNWDVPQQPVKFLYLLQTESCLSAYLQEVIGDPSICSCNVLVLSYRIKCDELPPSNVKYIYVGNRTSWGGGRNVLYEDAMKHGPVYLFYIFLDDDITIDREGNETKSKPWRRFEEFLRRVEPAAAAIDIMDRLWLRRAANGRNNMQCSQSVNKSGEYFSVARYDAAFNAFHNKTVRHILPYTSKFDNTSWIFSAMYMNIKIELMYAGHSVLHNKIFATNPSHRPYPKHWPDSSQWRNIVDEAANDLPEKYRNSKLLSGWRKDGIQHEQKSPTLCLPPPPPKIPIRQFAYLDGLLPV